LGFGGIGVHPLFSALFYFIHHTEGS